MPQMAPTLWILIALAVFLMVFVMKSFMYFNKQLILNDSPFKTKKNEKSWKW